MKGMGGIAHKVTRIVNTRGKKCFEKISAFSN